MLVNVGHCLRKSAGLYQYNATIIIILTIIVLSIMVLLIIDTMLYCIVMFVGVFDSPYSIVTVIEGRSDMN